MPAMTTLGPVVSPAAYAAWGEYPKAEPSNIELPRKGPTAVPPPANHGKAPARCAEVVSWAGRSRRVTSQPHLWLGVHQLGHVPVQGRWCATATPPAATCACSDYTVHMRARRLPPRGRRPGRMASRALAPAGR